MGGPWVLLSDGTLSDAALVALVQQEFDAINAAMSPWCEESELLCAGRALADGPVVVSAELAHVLGFALHLHRLSDGVFDPTLGGEVGRAGFGRTGRPVARGALRLDGQTLQSDGGVSLDLCAVAKGHAVDRAATALQRAGVQHFLLNLTGDLFAKGTAPGGAPWRVAVELPVPEQQVIFRKLPLRGALATSGTYRNQRNMGRVSHLINGQSGTPVAHGLLSVTVRAARTIEADGWATTLATLGLHQGPDLARKHAITALFVSETENGFLTRQIGDWT